ncbi:hypothetical protein BX666DRAFT_2051094 [Dichotomocladium elegans]|nr:hypothetical protein BX666DRAFT_2051094 [Dichotomocladium elegans]
MFAFAPDVLNRAIHSDFTKTTSTLDIQMHSNSPRQQLPSEAYSSYDINNADSSSGNRSSNDITIDIQTAPTGRSAPPFSSSSMAYLNHLEDDLSHLQDEWASVDVVLTSMKNAYSIHPLDNAPEELLSQVDRELCIGYDEVRSQVRQLSRSIERLEAELEPYLAIHRSQPPSLPKSSQGPPSDTALYPAPERKEPDGSASSSF